MHRLSKRRSLEARQDSHRCLVYPNSRTDEIIKSTVRRIHIEPSTPKGRVTHTSTHAGCEVYLPRSGRRGFDSAGGDYTAVAARRHPTATPRLADAIIEPASSQPVTRVEVGVGQLWKQGGKRRHNRY